MWSVGCSTGAELFSVAMILEQEGLLESAKQLGQLFERRFRKLQKECDLVTDVRVVGTMVGIELAVDGTPVVKGCLERKLLVNCTHSTVIRLLPAMNLPEEQAEEGCDILAEVIKGLPRQ